MYKNTDYIYDAASKLEQITGLTATVECKRKEHDAVININGQQFFVIARNEIRKGNEGLLINLVAPFENKLTSHVLIAKYISAETAQTLKSLKINYIDASGNCYIQTKDFFVYISGQKVQRKQKTNKAKAFHESGIKLLFQLLSNPNNLQLSYRELAELSDISIGSVSNIIAELESEHFILRTKTKRVLKNKPELLDRWIIAYHDVLRPRLLKKQMRFSNAETLANWKSLSLKGKGFWGEESGASLLTNHIIPETFTIYTHENWQTLGSSIGLVPDENGNVEILRQFWEKNDDYEDKPIVHPLLIYADLMQSGFGRNLETAKLILENELSYIK
ncbi:hypothetical protein LJC30_03875 [Odoribacter sp. OttesenSCG-928-L07]|nr:hypothetical protein [Odoribacter sp. OttesenSCG-928-L07]MDL2239476.1 hypothetical protein [Bacteroidales bacterium OttesenSCG-928-L14]MDL2240695.1 hypothetical protein [Bacteroidales bacterium OttesenSCG-928-K22]